mgnify:FL=1
MVYYSRNVRRVETPSFGKETGVKRKPDPEGVVLVIRLLLWGALILLAWFWLFRHS